MSKLQPFAGMRHLDVAGGTGDVAFRVLKAIRAAEADAAITSSAARQARHSAPPALCAQQVGPAAVMESCSVVSNNIHPCRCHSVFYSLELCVASNSCKLRGISARQDRAR